MYTCIGNIVDTQGLNGELRLKQSIDISEFFDKFDTVFLKSGSDYISYKVKKLFEHSKRGYVLSIEGVSDIRRAEYFILRDIYVPKEIEVGDTTVEVDADEIEFYTFINGIRYVLADVVENSHNDLLQLVNEDGKEIMVPHIDHFVTDIDHDTGEIFLQNVEGLDEI